MHLLRRWDLTLLALMLLCGMASTWAWIFLSLLMRGGVLLLEEHPIISGGELVISIGVAIFAVERIIDRFR